MKRRLLAAAAACVFVGMLLILSSTRAQFMPGPASWAPSAAPCTSTSTWNPADSSVLSISSDGCTATASSAASFNAVRSHTTSYLPAGAAKVYFELGYLAETTPSNGFWIGGIGTLADPTAGAAPGVTVMHGIGLQLSNGGSPPAKFYTGAGGTTLNPTVCNPPAPGPGVWVGIAVVFTSGAASAWCTLNGTTWNTGGSDTPVGAGSGGFLDSGLPTTAAAVAWSGGDNAKAVINTSAPFHFTVPSGFSAFASLADKRQYAGDVPR